MEEQQQKDVSLRHTLAHEESFVYKNGYVEGKITYKLLNSSEKMEHFSLVKSIAKKRDEVEEELEPILKKHEKDYQKDIDEFVKKQRELLEKGEIDQEKFDLNIAQGQRVQQMAILDIKAKHIRANWHIYNEMFQFVAARVIKVDMRVWELEKGFTFLDVKMDPEAYRTWAKTASDEEIAEEKTRLTRDELREYYERAVKKEDLKIARNIDTLEALSYENFNFEVVLRLAKKLPEGYDVKK